MYKLLLVDDDEMSRDMLSRRLVKKGYEVITAEDGLVAIQTATDEAPDLIIMDIRMPNLDGWGAIKRIKGNPLTSKIPIIVLTAYSGIDDQINLKNFHCDGYEIKPVNLDNLLKKIEDLL